MPNLRSLTLKHFNFGRENWLGCFPVELSNIAELHLINVQLGEKVNEFAMFLSRLTNLQVFVHLRRNEFNPRPERIADCLYQRFPQLRGFGCNVNDRHQPHGFSMNDKFKFLEKFTNMTVIYVGNSDSSSSEQFRQITCFSNSTILSPPTSASIYWSELNENLLKYKLSKESRFSSLNESHTRACTPGHAT